MDLVIEDSGGGNIVAREMGEPDWDEPATVDAHEVEVWRQDIDPDTGAPLDVPTRVGRFPAVGAVPIPNTPDSDRDVRVYFMPFSADGRPGFTELRDATQLTVLFRRETAAPVIGQNAPATTDSVEVGITGFTRFARFRRVTISENADMSDPAAVLLFGSEDYAARELPRYLTLTREAGLLTTEGGTELLAEDGSWLAAEDTLAALPRTVYVTVAHSGGSAWTPESNILEVTFAAGDGTGGSAGGFDPTPRDFSNLDTL